MAGFLRLSKEIVSHAKVSATLQKRSVPKQIEYWAELGRHVEQKVEHSGLMAILKNMAIIEVKPIPSDQIDPDEVFQALEADRASGKLSATVTSANVIYEASRSHPGLLDRIGEDGERTTGSFENGEFRPGVKSITE